MDYKNYLEQELGNVFNKITNEANFNYKAGDRALVLKEMIGQNYKTSRLIPIQLMAYGDDVMLLLGVLRDFAQTHSKVTIIDGLEFIKQDYATPTTINLFNEVGEVYANIVMLTGTLIISDNVSDIEVVEVDGELIEFDDATIVYAAQIDTKKRVDSPLAKSKARFGSNRIQVAAISKSTALLQKVRNIRKGLLPTDTTFNIKLTYIDNDYTESFIVRLDGYSHTSSSANMPISVLSFTE